MSNKLVLTSLLLLLLVFGIILSTPFAHAQVYATWNPADKSAGVVLSNDDTTAISVGNAWKGVRSTQYIDDSCSYWEINIDNVNDGDSTIAIGIATESADFTGPAFYTGDAWAYNSANGNKRALGVDSSFGSALIDGDVIGIAFDGSSGTLTYWKNGILIGDAFTGLLSDSYYALFNTYYGTEGVTANFGASSFSFPESIPEGCSAGIFEGEEATSTPPTATSSSEFNGTLNNPNQDLFNGICLFLFGFTFIIWNFRRPRI